MVGLDPQIDGSGTLKNLFCSGDCWSRFRVYGWCDHKMKRRLLENNLCQPSMEANPWFASPSPHVTTNHVNHVSHDSAINELVNQAATKSHQRWSLEAKNQRINMRMVMKVTLYLRIHSLFGGAQKFFRFRPQTFGPFPGRSHQQVIKGFQVVCTDIPYHWFNLQLGPPEVPAVSFLALYTLLEFLRASLIHPWKFQWLKDD